MGWQCAIVSIAYLAGTIIQGLVVLNNPNYDFQRWHGTLLVIAITMFSIIFNTFLAKRLPFVEVLILILHVCGLFAIIIPLWVLGPRRSAKQVFTEFNNGGAWDSAGTATLVGFSTTITALIGYDCAVHMSEEIKDASDTLPKAMITSVCVNAASGFLMLVTVCFTLGDIDDILSTPTGYPFMQVFYNATESLPGTNTMTAILVLTLTASTITEVATASRQLWSFARDRGLPFSDFFGYVNPSWNIPLNAVMVSLAVTVLLSLINIGSTTALLAIVTLTIGAMMSSYIITIACLLLKRIRREPLPPHRWTLGRFGMAINIGALCFLCPVFVFAFFPLTSTVEPDTMNWCAVIARFGLHAAMAIKVPPGQSPPFETIDDKHHAGIIIITGAICLMISLVCLLIRVYVRVFLNPPWGSDDIILLGATIFAIAESIIIFHAASIGFGTDISLLTEKAVDRIQNSLFAADILYLLTLYLSKCCIIAIYLRLTPREHHKSILWATFGLSTVGVIVSVLGIAVNCEGNKPWAVPGEQCHNLFPRWQAIAALDISTEILLFTFSIALVWGLQMRISHKIVIMVSFAARLPLIIFSALHLSTLKEYTTTKNPTLTAISHTVFTQLHLNYAIITCTVFCLRPFMNALTTYYGTAGDSNLGSSSGGYGTGEKSEGREDTDECCLLNDYYLQHGRLVI
ncbi:hypothetical protein PENARI_c003G02958 [Penicillium arizonense]|uniref:Rhodopsin domain-containing protein n=1 Tax=Penicillium arizonense TaxID=1835702 RepID=A0A1F5LTM0_PENAI|nr:hypothetical protein PENARI_c003G02958 [Penicillium arizonense]OGE56390.1 hypothetical protein PENARI_c003G02958 [Penicillium arizonense]